MPSSPSGVFVGLPQATLDALRVSALARVTSGDRTSVSGGGKSGTKAWSMSAEDVLREIKFAEQQNGTRPPRVSKVYQTTSPDYPHRRY